jgi:hypothetical protein
VNAKDTGLSVYPGATLKPNTKDDKHTANVNIDTPWFGVKVVALTYQSPDSPDKIKAYYQKEMSEFGRVLDCSPGSADMSYKPANKEDVSCREGEEHHRVQMDEGENQLKVGSRDRQRVVGYKKHDNGTEFTLVYVNAHGGEKETE